MSCVALRGVNKRTPINRPELDEVDDFKLIDTIKEKNLTVNLPAKTKKRLIELLEIKNETIPTKILNKKNGNLSIEDFQSQLDQLQEKYNNLNNQSAAINSFGKIAAILMWDLQLKLGKIFQNRIILITNSVFLI